MFIFSSVGDLPIPQAPIKYIHVLPAVAFFGPSMHPVFIFPEPFFSLVVCRWSFLEHKYSGERICSVSASFESDLGLVLNVSPVSVRNGSPSMLVTEGDIAR